MVFVTSYSLALGAAALGAQAWAAAPLRHCAAAQHWLDLRGPLVAGPRKIWLMIVSVCVLMTCECF